jgi:alpha-L-rhamnosidase
MARVYGDVDILAKHYDAMKAFVEYQNQTHKDYVRAYPGFPGFDGFGDWLSTNADTPKDLIATAFFAYSADLISKIATTLGKADDSTKYRALFDAIADSFRRHFVTPEGDLVSRTQTSYVLALRFGLLDEATIPKAVDALVHEIERRGDHLSTGFLGTPYLAHVLSDHGRADVAFRLLMQKSYPSWLYPVTQGATTIWERWDGWTHDKGFQDAGMNSFNHYAYGAIGEWMYGRIAGIEMAEGDLGYRRLAFRPLVGGGLTWASGWLETVRGRVEAAWKVEDGTFRYSILVPPGATGVVELPSGESHAVGSGRHEFRSSI